MRITSADVMSVNAKITKGVAADARTWASAEDWQHFSQLMGQHDVIVLGRNTYDDLIRLTLEKERLRVVLTHHPEQYAAKAVPGQLEFVNASPAELLEQLKARGFERLLLVGGQVNSQFWAAGLVDEAYITIEPLVFGKGQDFLSGVESDTKLRLLEVKQLNKQGTLLAHYAVEK
jgi:dihydrofolate reductase